MEMKIDSTYRRPSEQKNKDNRLACGSKSIHLGRNITNNTDLIGEAIAILERLIMRAEEDEKLLDSAIFKKIVNFKKQLEDKKRLN